MKKKYNHLTLEQRTSIGTLLKANVSKKEISKVLGISESTLYRELKRNSKPRSYNAKHAQILADERLKDHHLKNKLTLDMELYIERKLKLYWSPEQIVGRAKTDGIPMLSVPSIYKYIALDKSKDGNLHKYLRTANKRYKKQYGSSDKRGQIADKVNISERPKQVDNRTRIGDFEIDLIIGKNHKGAQLTIVDRMSGFTLIHTLKSKKAEEVSKTLIVSLKPYKNIVKTITTDNGKEFALHKRLAKQLSADVFFCNPYASYEKGQVENTNKLIRQFYPKKMELDNIKQKQNLEIMDLLNKRPRKKLGYKTPEEVFFINFEIENRRLALAC